MKSFKEFVTEAAEQPLTHGGASELPGPFVKIKTPDGWADCSVKLVTPESPADKAYWEISNSGDKIHGRISPDQVKGLGPNEERVLTIDGKEYWFGGVATGGKNKATA